MDPLALLTLLAGALLLMGAGLALLAGGRRSPLDRRLETFVGSATATLGAGDPAPARSNLADRLERYFSERGFFARVRARIARADVKLRVSEYLILTVLSAAAAGLLLYYFFDGGWILSGLGILAGFYLPRIYLNVAAGRRVRAFNDQLSDTLSLWVNALRSGYSVLQSMEALASEMPAPVSQEFERVVQEVRLGLSLEQALNNMLRRVPSDDLDLVITAVNIQREVGGNLTEVLDAISLTIRERVRIKGEIRALTAQSRLSGWIIGLLPFILGLVMYRLNPDYVSQLWARGEPYLVPGILPVGWVAIAVAALMLGVGVLFIRRIIDIEV